MSLISKEELEQFMDDRVTVWNIAKIKGCCKQSIVNYVRKYKLKTFKGFYYRDDKIRGREKGFKHTQEFKDLLSKKFSGEGNPFFGKKHNKETKKQMSENHADFSGDKNPFGNKFNSNEEFREKFKEKHLLLWDSRNLKWRKRFAEKLSYSMSNSDKLDNIINKSHLRGYHCSSKIPNGGFSYRSSWELYFACCLDAHNMIEEYKYENITIPYTDEIKDINRNTRIDFYIKTSNGKIAIVEIKPRPLIKLQYDKIIGHQCFCLENNFQYLLLDGEFFFKKNKIFQELNMTYKGEKYVRVFD